MALASIQNRKGFFSDYWLGSLLSARSAAGARLSAAQAKKALDRVGRLVEGMEGADAPDLTRFRERFARPVLEELLGYELHENAAEPRLRPLAAANGNGGSPVALAWLHPEAAELDSPRPRRQLEAGLLAQSLDYGILLTPRVARLVRRPGLGARGAALDINLASIAEEQDLESLSAAYRLLAAHNFVPSESGNRPIDALEAESRRHSAKVSNDLKDAVFEAAERIVGGFLADVRSRPGDFATPPSAPELRDAGFLALYRLLFILYAEARDERLIGHPLYQRSYSLDSIVAKLLKTPPRALAANRGSLWPHVQAIFRIFNEGMALNLPNLENIPPRGGRLFSDETAEGGLVKRLRLDDRQAAAILLALATTRPRRGVGRERVSFRELEIEQLGAVYEGLLEYEPAEAREVLIECSVAGRELVLVPAEVVRLAKQKALVVRGDLTVVAGTEAERLHPDAAADGDDEVEADKEGEAAEESGDSEEEAEKGVKRGATLKLVKRLEPGAFFFKPGSARKASGSYYTVTEIVDYLVRESLGPLSAGKSAAEIEGLRIIDLACGSAHFLVGAARFLGPRLFEAYKRGGDPPAAFHPDEALSADVRRRWEEEGAAWCKRRIVEKCLFGVDLNPAAVQLAQVALWIEALAGDRPLSFFAHHIRNGNSLLGSWLANFDRPPHPKLGKPSDRRTMGLFEVELKKRLQEALSERRLIDAPLPREVRADTADEYAYKEDRLHRAEAATAQARILLDLRNAAAFLPAIWRELPALMSSLDLERDARSRPWWADFEVSRKRERFFHWELEFPEVFAAGGFDCVLGNPPWEKVKPDRKEFYGHVDVLIRAYAGGELDARIRELHRVNPALSREFDTYSEQLKTLASCLKGGGDYRYVDWEIDGQATGGDPDLFKFFVERAHQVLKNGGRLGYLVPSAIYNNEGCTGLRYLLLDETTIERFYGFENRKKIFEIDSRYKFVCMVARKEHEPQRESEFRAVFMRHELAELESGPPAGVQVLVKRSEIEQLSPGTLALLEYRNERDRKLVLKMYRLLNGQQPRPTLGDQSSISAWKANLHRELHATDDRDLWTRSDGQLWTAQEVCGLNWPTRPGLPFLDVRAAMEQRGFWPLYDGKNIEQFLVDVVPVDRWVNLEAHERKFKRLPRKDSRVVMRDIARNTDARTCIATVLPEKSCTCHTLVTMDVEAIPLMVAAAVVNSFAFDFLARLRAAGTHISWTFMSRIAVPSPAECRSIPAIATFSADGSNALERDEHYFEAVWRANRAVTEAYGLSRLDFEHVLGSFPVFTRKHPELQSFLKTRVAEWEVKEGG